ncbi:DUF742 domain-containing protein [Amycolatopsis ultiminotia]|uniref:DUF742 domain-containing protein n=1 Tax=Amycolatopsis ultiminotia TaxID=543629 RepID=A0ABP6WRR2_9PSEU
MRISGFGEQDTGAWDALHRGDEREQFDSPSRFELSTLKTMLPRRRPHAPRPAPAEPEPEEPPAGHDDGWASAVDDSGGGHEWAEDGASGYWAEEPPAPAHRGQHAAAEGHHRYREQRAEPSAVEQQPDPYSFDEYAGSSGSPGRDDRVVPEGSAYRRHRAAEVDRPSGRSRHALAEEPEAHPAELDQFWSAAAESGAEPPRTDEQPGSAADEQSGSGTAKPAKSRVRPYARTRGRTRSDHNLALEALVSTSDDGRCYRGVRSIEHRRICDLCLDTRSVAEIAAHLHLPLGVVKVLVGDMADIGLVLLHQTELVLGDRSSREFMERVLQGLRSL